MNIREAIEEAIRLSGLNIITVAELAVWNREKNLAGMFERDIDLSDLEVEDGEAWREIFVHDPSGQGFGLYRRVTAYLNGNTIYDIFVEDCDRNEVWTPDIERMKAQIIGIEITE